MAPVSDELKREIGQHFVFGFHGFEASEDVKSLIRDYRVGNIILMKRNVKDAAQVRRLVNELQATAQKCGHERPLLIGIDQENGLVSAFSSPAAGTQFPGAMAMAATGSAELAERVAAACGRELKLVGINWVYSPVGDVNSDPRNPVIGVRSFGDDPLKVTKFARAVSAGLISSGVASCAKHFPGHGDTHVDSHLALPRIVKDKKALKSTELIPFITLMQSGVPSVMTGHMALPLITGGDMPSSLSPTITRGLLRQELGYDGLVVTDCLEMDAVASLEKGGCGVAEGAVRALEAGADVAMICHTMERQVGAVKAVWQAVESGRLDIDNLKKGTGRISRVKDVYAGGWDSIMNLGEEFFQKQWTAVKTKNTKLSRDAYKKSTTLVWDKGGILPLTRLAPKLVALYTPEMESLNRAVDDAEGGGIGNTLAGTSYQALAPAVGQWTDVRHIVYVPSDVTLDLGYAEELGAIIFVLRNADKALWQRTALNQVLRQRKKNIPLVLISSCGPYDFVGQTVEEDLVAYIQTFEFTAAALEAATEMMFDLIR
ncbi:hypothetical protein AX17_006160 [Amanita inopinata Kibby_2008]|nr:hypothetical protein AX17_006160 [Amanita inopinata Kibby_2008]